MTQISRELCTLAGPGGTRSRGQGLANQEEGPPPPRPRCRDTRRRGASSGFSPEGPGKLRRGGRVGAFVGRTGAPGGGLAAPADLPPAAPAQVRNPESLSPSIPPDLVSHLGDADALKQNKSDLSVFLGFSGLKACRETSRCPLSRPAKARPMGRIQEPQRKNS